MERKKVKVVHEQDLDDFLRSLGLLELLEKGELRCGICREKVDRVNLQCVYPEGNEVKVACNKLDCYEKAVSIARAK